MVQKNVIELCGGHRLVRAGVLKVLESLRPEAEVRESGAAEPAALYLWCVESWQRERPMLEKLRAEDARTPMLVLSPKPDEEQLLQCLALCAGLQSHAISPEALCLCVRLSLKGAVAADEGAVAALAKTLFRLQRLYALTRQETAPPVPTETERRLAEYILRGMENEEIGRAMYLSAGTVKNKISVILEKYGFRSRAQIIMLLLW